MILSGIFSFDVPLWTMILLTCCSVLIYKYATQPGHIWKDLGVPTPPPAPFIGHMHRIYDPKTGFRGSIERWTKQYGKIFGILFFRHPMLVVTDIDAVKEVLVKDFTNFTNRYAGPSGLYQPIIHKSILFNGGASWRKVRHIMSPSFSNRKLKLLTRHINRNALNLIESFNMYIDRRVRPEAKVVFSAFSLDVLAGAAFGLEMNSHNNLNGSFYQHAKGLVTFRKYLRLVIATLGAFPFLGGLFKMLDIGFFVSGDISYFKEQFTQLISERRKIGGHSSKDDDFLNFLINGEHDTSLWSDADDIGENKKLTTEEIVAQSIIFVIAGYETTSATLQWLTYELSKREDVQKRIRKEIDDVIGDIEDSDNVSYEHCQKLKYTEAVIHEALRMYPPVVTLSRMAKNATKLKGVSVPANAAVIIPVYNICRDPELFEDPDTFNPERFLSTCDSNSNSNSNSTNHNYSASSLLASLPFGFGPRQCLGFSLAILQVKIALVHILRSFSIQGATPEHVDIDDFTALLIPKQPIHLILEKL